MPRGRAGRRANPAHTGAAVARAARERGEQERETPHCTTMRLHLPAHVLSPQGLAHRGRAHPGHHQRHHSVGPHRRPRPGWLRPGATSGSRPRTRRWPRCGHHRRRRTRMAVLEAVSGHDGGVVGPDHDGAGAALDTLIGMEFQAGVIARREDDGVGPQGRDQLQECSRPEWATSSAESPVRVMGTRRCWAVATMPYTTAARGSDSRDRVGTNSCTTPWEHVVVDGVEVGRGAAVDQRGAVPPPAAR